MGTIWEYLYRVLSNWAGYLLIIDGIVALLERYFGELVEQRWHWRVHIPTPIKLGFALFLLFTAQGIAYQGIRNEVVQTGKDNDALHVVINAMAVQIQSLKQQAETAQNAVAHPDGLPPPGLAMIRILANGNKLDGQSFKANSDGLVSLPLFQLKNSGSLSTQHTSIRLYFSQPVTPSTNEGWQVVQSGEDKFPSEFYFTVLVPISPGEPWSIPELGVTLTKGLSDPVQAKMEVFYEAEKPTDAFFTIHRSAP